MNFLLLFRPALAEEPPETLARIDQILAADGAMRAPLEENKAFCSTDELNRTLAPQRAFLCRGTENLGDWALAQLLADGGLRYQAELGLRRFPSASAAAEARADAIARYGGERAANLEEGSLSWCWTDVIWDRELLWTLEYTCAITLKHVHALNAIREVLLARGEPTHGAVGILGSHSGWSRLLGPSGRSIVVPDAERFTQFAYVRGVAPNDTLSVRLSAFGASSMNKAILARLAPDARCIPVLYRPDSGPVYQPNAPPWWRIAVGSTIGWASSTYLALEPVGSCP